MRQPRFSPVAALDSFPPRAQPRSSTNKIPLRRWTDGAGFKSWLMLTDATAAADKIGCDACPVMCYIKPGAAGACDRYANHNGELVRVDPHVVLERTVSHGGRLVPFQASGDWDGTIVCEPS